MLRIFEIEESTTVGAASRLLAPYGESAKIYAGGTELLLVMKEGLAHYERLINIKKIPRLSGVQYDDKAGLLRIGL